MKAMPSKTGYYVLEGLNSFATAYFFNYLLFLFRDQFGFNDLNNLVVGALHGLIYIPASLVGGRFGQRWGAFRSLRIGFGGMAVAVGIGWWFPGLWGQFGALTLWTVVLCFTWPILEGLVCEHETPERLPHRVGLYNVVWAGTAAVGYSSGGWLFEQLGRSSLYWLPLGIHVVQWIATWPLEARHRTWVSNQPASTDLGRSNSVETGNQPHFKKLAWLANPFNYMAVNTLLAVAPGLASRAGLGLAEAGVVLSVWLYIRALAFLKLWLWPGWHYRFDWFLGGLLTLLVSFVALVSTSSIWGMVLAQIGFGWATAILYYSSLYYAMDGTDAHSENGGIHEALIGIGIFGGPALSGLAQFITGNPSAPAWVLAGLLSGASGWVWRIHRRSQKRV